MTTVAIERAVLRAGYHEDYMTRPGRIVATIELHRIGDQESYFSVTGAIYEGQRREPDSAGCIHEQILTVWPQLAPLVELHLSTADGVPMHAEANGWFWLNVEPKRTNERLFGYKAPDNWMWRWTSPAPSMTATTTPSRPTRSASSGRSDTSPRRSASAATKPARSASG